MILLDLAFGVFGLLALLAIAWAFSSDRRAVNWRLVAIGVALQLAFAIFVLMTPWGAAVFGALSKGFVALLSFTQQGAQFIFGDLARVESFGFVFAFQVLPTIIFFASFMAVLYHLGVMQKIVQTMAWVITKLMPVSGAETLSVCANAFIGQTEAPLVVKPYIARMTESELLTLMVGGMATIAGGVLAAYVQMLGGGDPESQQYFARHLITASIMAAPAALVIAKILKPETAEPATRGAVKVEIEQNTVNVIDAAASGAADGLKLALNVGAMLLAFIALIALVDAPIAWLGRLTGLEEILGRPLGFATLLGYVLSPVAWLIGVPWTDAIEVGGLIGTKVVLNEFVAYSQLATIEAALAPHSVLIATYALCGFANFSSIAIQIGGIGGIAPERRSDLARLGLRAVLGGSLATFMTATIAGVIAKVAGG